MFRDLVCGLALLVHGTSQEKAKCRSLLIILLYLIIHYNDVTIFSTHLANQCYYIKLSVYTIILHCLCSCEFAGN